MLNPPRTENGSKLRVHEAQPYGLTDFTEVAGALGQNRPIRHPFFADRPITSATVNPFTRHAATL
jgi:hypothetical protein